MSVSICVNQRVTVTTDVSESLTMPADLGSIKIEPLENTIINNRFESHRLYKAILTLDKVNLSIERMRKIAQNAALETEQA